MDERRIIEIMSFKNKKTEKDKLKSLIAFGKYESHYHDRYFIDYLSWRTYEKKVNSKIYKYEDEYSFKTVDLLLDSKYHYEQLSSDQIVDIAKKKIDKPNYTTGSLDLDSVIKECNLMEYGDELEYLLYFMDQEMYEESDIYSPSLASYILEQAAKRDGIFDDYKTVTTYISGEKTVIKRKSKGIYTIKNELLPDCVVDADDMYEAVKQIPYLLGLTNMFRESDVIFDE
jgi:hypothetical protein